MESRDVLDRYPFFRDGAGRLDEMSEHLRITVTIDPAKALFIQEHSPDGRFVAVANMVIELLAQTAALHCELLDGEERSLHEIRELRFLRVIDLAPGETRSLEVISEAVSTVGEDGILCSVGIQSNATNAERRPNRAVMHASANVLLRRNPPRTRRGIVPKSEQAERLLFQRRLFYERFVARGEGLQFTFDEVSYDRGTGALIGHTSLGDRAPLFSHGRGPLITHPLIGDAGLQLQFLLFKIAAQSVRVPVSIATMQFYGTIGTDAQRSYRISVSATHHDDQISTCNIEIVDSLGWTLVEYLASSAQRHRAFDHDAQRFARFLEDCRQ